MEKSDSNNEAAPVPRSIVFSSDDLPVGLDNRKRMSLWRDLYSERFGACEASCDPDRVFFARSEFAQFGDVGYANFDGTMNRFVRTRQHIAGDAGGDFFFIGFNNGDSSASISQGSRESEFSSGRIIFLNGAEPTNTIAPADRPWRWTSLSVPRSLLLKTVYNAEDLAVTAFDPRAPAARHLKRYIESLTDSEDIANEPALNKHIGSTLFDLLTLVLGANRDAVEIARMRGLRAARAREILAAIKLNYANPGFTSARLAQKLSLSQRYINDLLFETGISFAERVTELRLQKAYAMLVDPRFNHLRVSEVSEACGFNEVPYFNRQFRKRFGAPPNYFRGSGVDG